MNRLWLTLLLHTSIPRADLAPTVVGSEAELIQIKTAKVADCDGIWGGTVVVDQRLLGCWVEARGSFKREWFGPGKTILGFRLPASKQPGKYSGTRLLFACFARDKHLVAKVFEIKATSRCSEKAAVVVAPEPWAYRNPTRQPPGPYE